MAGVQVRHGGLSQECSVRASLRQMLDADINNA
jgi:hypothetical protein